MGEVMAKIKVRSVNKDVLFLTPLIQIVGPLIKRLVETEFSNRKELEDRLKKWSDLASAFEIVKPVKEVILRGDKVMMVFIDGRRLQIAAVVEAE